MAGGRAAPRRPGRRGATSAYRCAGLRGANRGTVPRGRTLAAPGPCTPAERRGRCGGGSSAGACPGVGPANQCEIAGAPSGEDPGGAALGMSVPSRLALALGGRYAIERELGAGGMATVYLARDLKHDREVALKVLRPELAAALGTERFLQEIRISARLDHPHILTLIDSGESDGFVWYALPYVRGESLRARLSREKQLSVEEAVRIATQVAGALDFAHRQGVVHRDIKPENILLHEGLAVVADFGIALAASQAGGDRLTLSGLSLGTPQYMSPEQATGSKDIDSRSDVYSLGAMVYEALTGEPPHTGPTVQAVIAKLLTERPTRIRVVRDAVPQAIDDAVAKALAKVPSDRFARAGDFAAALAAKPAPAGRPSRRVAWAAAGLAVALLAAVLVLWSPFRPSAPPPAAGAATESPSVAVLPFENLTGNTAD